MVHNYDKNWSNLSKNEFNVSMSVWGYLHNEDGSINQKTEKYISLMSPIILVLQSIGENGTKKGWYYVEGPKETPIMIMGYSSSKVCGICAQGVISNLTSMVKDEHLGKDGFTFLPQSNGDIIDATEIKRE